MEWTELDPDHRLTYLIGDIVRSDVFVEGETGSVYQVIASASSTPPSRRPADLAHLLDATKEMLRDLEMDDFPRDMARQAIIASKAAHKARIGPVHDRWMHQGGSDERWVSIAMLTTQSPKVAPTPQNLESFLECRDALLHAGWRMRGVSLVLPMWLGLRSQLDDLGDRDVQWWTAVALGQFRVPRPNGLWDVDVDEELALPASRQAGKA